MPTISADPYPWPFDGDLTPQNTALIVIDMQTDFCGKGGYVDSMGYDLSLTRAPIAPIRSVLAAARAKGYHVLQSAIPDHVVASWCAGRQGGRSFRILRRRPASRSSTSPARDHSAPQIWS